MSEPTLVVRVAGNLSEMKANLAEGVSQIETYKGALQRAAASFDGSRIIQQASAAAAAIQNAGGVTTLTAAEMAKANAIFTQAAEKMQLMGQGSSYAGQAFSSLAAATKGASDSSDGLGKSWVLRIAEGQLLRDAVREVITGLKNMIEYFPDLAVRGAVVGDVEQAFKRLSAQAGLLSDQLLGTLRAGTHGTVDDFTLMKRANEDMAAGLNLTQAQFGLLSQGAFALAKATGGSVTEALDKMSDALVTGRAKAVALLTGKIDLKAAEDAYATSLGATVDQLAPETKLEADRQAILDGVKGAVARLGTQQDSLKDKIDQGKTSWANYQDELAKTIAASPVIAAAFQGLETGLRNAFGGDQQASIRAIAQLVDQLGIYVVDLGIGAVTVGGSFVQIWGGIKTAVLTVEDAIVQMTASLLKSFDVIVTLETKVPGLGSAYTGLKTTLDGLTESADATAAGLDAEVKEAAQAAMGHSALSKSIDTVGGVLFGMRDAMLAAGSATVTATTATEGATAAVSAHAAALRDSAAALKAQQSLEAEYAVKTAEVWNQYFENQSNRYATDAQRAEAAALKKYLDDVAKAKAAGVEDVAFYNARWALYEQDVQNAHVNYKKISDASEESLRKNADDADATFKAMETSGQHFSLEAIRQMQQWRDAAHDAIYSIKIDYAALDKQSILTLQDNYNNALATLQYAEDNAGQFRRETIDHLRDVKDQAFDALHGIADENKKTTDGFIETWGGVEGHGKTAAEAMANAFDNAEKRIVDDQHKMSQAFGVEYDLTTLAGVRNYQNLNPGALINDVNKVIDLAKSGQTLQQMIASGLIDPYYKLKQDHPEWGGNLPGFADGTDNAPGGWAVVGERGPELLNLPRGAQVIPSDHIGPGSVNVHINVAGHVLGTSKTQLAAIVEDALATAMRKRGDRLPVTARN